ncbi:MAG: hypothetical protein ACOX64_09185 [Candidatus Merdivicinus sp.]|jgi:hypothetical protein
MGKYTDFSQSYIWIAGAAPQIERKAAWVLAEEIEKRTGIRLPVENEPLSGRPYLYIGSSVPEELADGIESLAAPGTEGCRILVDGGRAAAVGADPRGCMYGAGRLLRMMKWGENVLEFPVSFAKTFTPRFPIRGHQLGYRQKTNAYDAWTRETYEQYIRELVLFGANGIEILPPRTDDSGSRALMKYDQLEMMCFLSETIHSYGADVWVWYPYLEKEFNRSEVIAGEEAERREVFGKVPYIDHVFIPGGDPGDLRPKDLFACARWTGELLHRQHPCGKIWISPQTGIPSTEWTEEFYAEVDKQPDWLTGIVFAPWEKDSAEALRSRIPARYPIRNYPDITHMLRSQYPVPQWDMAMALTLGRECTNPRPLDEKNIHNLYQDSFVGSISYSEGINDDVNKFVWLDQEWDSSTPVIATLRDYAGLFIDWGLRDEIAQGFLAEEENLRGPIAINSAIEQTFDQWTAIEQRVGRYAEGNYRFEMGLIRAYFDRYQKERYQYEQYLEQEACRRLSAGTKEDVGQALAEAEEILLRAKTNPIRIEWIARIEELADLLFEHIGAQLTVTRHHAAGYERGAYVDSLNVPLNDSRYILTCLKRIKSLETGEEKCAAVYELLHRTDPGPGGFYDSFESFGRCWERLGKRPEYLKDPACLDIPLPSFLLQSPFAETDVPLAWRTNVYTLYQKPLIVTYQGLDPEADYWYRATYGRYHTIDLSLDAGEKGEISLHGPVHIDQSFCTVTLKLPKEAYRSGKLILRLSVQDGQRGPNVSEIMITKRPLTENIRPEIESC